MEDKIHPIITRPHEYEVIFFGYQIDNDDYANSYIDIHFKKDNKVIKLRFSQPADLEIEKGFNGNISGMEIFDIRERQLDDIGVKVSNFEQDSGVTFLAKKVIELNE